MDTTIKEHIKKIINFENTKNIIEEINKYTFIPYDNITKEIDYMKLLLIICITFLIMTFLQIFIWLKIHDFSFEKIKKCNKKEKLKKGKHNLNNNDMDGIIARYFMLL
jgi:uncharacterized protein HemY